MTVIKLLFLFQRFCFCFRNIIYSLNVFITVWKYLDDHFVHIKWRFIENKKMLMTQTIVKFCNILAVKWQTIYTVLPRNILGSNWPKILLANYCIITTSFFLVLFRLYFHYSGFFFAIKFNPFSTPSAINIFHPARIKCIFKE